MPTLKLLNKNTLSLSCTYEDKDKAKSINSYRWNKASRSWLYPFRRDIVDSILKTFPHVLFFEEVKEAYQQDKRFYELSQSIKQQGNCQVESLTKLPLRNYQKVGVKFLSLFDKAALFDDMGLGKTIQSLYFALYNKSQAHKCLILCPKSVKISVWANQIEKFTDEKYIIVEGSTLKREKLYDKFLYGDYYFLISSYETYRVSFPILKKMSLIKSIDPKKSNDDIEFGNGINLMVLDEATKIKNYQAQITKCILKTKLKFALLLTGTPYWNRVEDIYTQIQFIKPGLLGSTFWAFQDKYLKKGGYGGHEIIGYQNLDELKEKVESISIRREKSEVQEIPDKIYERRILDLDDPEQKKDYETMRDELIVWVKTLDDQEIKVKAQELLTRNLRLSQIADGFLSSVELNSVKYYDRGSKFKEIDTIINDYALTHQIVIFSRFLAIIDFLVKKYSCEPYYAVDLQGKMKDEQRAEAINSFQKGKSRIFISQIQTGGMGIDLSCADIQIFIDKAFIAPGTLRQAEDRSHRFGLKNKLSIISLICKGTIDYRWESLMRKKQKQIGKIFPSGGIKIERRMKIEREDWLDLLKK